ncbi:MAG TPA: response regulator transcription factor [Syntrophales bacterium]|nr:response regulator transcription factor [Syntrophales bacterium]
MQQYKSIKPQPGKNLHVLIVDNNPVERLGIETLLSEEYDLDMTTAPCDHHELFELLGSRMFHLIMIDSVLPGGSAFDIILLIRKIHEVNPQMPILVMGSGNHHLALWAFQAGASGYIDKCCDQVELIASARCILKGKRYLHSDIAEELPLLWTKPGELVLPHKKLSNRETQVMLLLAKGITVTEIGIKMGLSKKTISTYKTRVQEKMGMKSTVDMVKYAIKLGLVPTHS